MLKMVEASKKEKALMRKIARGDRQAKAELYNQFYERILRFVARQVDSHEQDAEDITHDTLLAAIEGAGSFRGESELYVWLCGIAWRKASDHRRRRDHPHTPQATKEKIIDSVVTPLDIEEMLMTLEQRGRVQRILRSLPRHYQQVLSLKYMQEYKVADIALIMGKTEKAVESLLTRARDAFREAAGKNK